LNQSGFEKIFIRFFLLLLPFLFIHSFFLAFFTLPFCHSFFLRPSVGCRSVGWSVCHNFLNGRQVSLPCSYRSTFCCLINHPLISHSLYLPFIFIYQTIYLSFILIYQSIYLPFIFIYLTIYVYFFLSLSIKLYIYLSSLSIKLSIHLSSLSMYIFFIFIYFCTTNWTN